MTLLCDRLDISTSEGISLPLLNQRIDQLLEIDRRHQEDNTGVWGEDLTKLDARDK